MPRCRRRSWDFYPTPDWGTLELQHHLEITGDVIEPCSGRLDIAKALTQFESPPGKIYTNDLDPTTVADFHLDASLPETWEKFPMVDWVVTNPPFAKAMEILKHARKHALNGVAFLLRVTFLEPTTERAQWLKANPPSQLIVLPRMSFTGDGHTDSATCAWMIWPGTRNNPVTNQPYNFAKSPPITITIPPIQDDFEDM